MKRQKAGGNSFLKQAAVLAAASLIVRFIGFLYRVPLTNLIGDEGNAIYSAGYYIYTFLLILSSAGLPAAISKMVSERVELGQYRNAHNVFKISLYVSSILGIFFMLILIATAEKISAYIEVPESYYTLLTLSPTLFIVAIMSVFRGYFQGIKIMMPTALSQIVEQIFNAFFSVYLAWILIGKGIEFGAAGGTAGTGIGALAGLIMIMFSYMLYRGRLKKILKQDTNFKNTETASHIVSVLFSTAIPIIAGTAVFSITNLIDMKMVVSRLIDSGFSAEMAKKLYGQLSGKYVTLTTLPVSISTAMATAAIPNIASTVVSGNSKSLKYKINMTIRLAMIISIPAAVGIGVLGDQILYLLFPAHPEGGILLKVGAISIIFLALCQIVTGVLQGIGLVYVPVIGAALGAVVKIILNYILIGIPKINVVGAVISTIGCYVTAAFVDILMLWVKKGVVPDLKGSLLKPIFCSIVMGAGCYGFYSVLYSIFPNNTVITILAIMFAVVLYGFIMILCGGITKNDLLMTPGGDRIYKIVRKFM